MSSVHLDYIFLFFYVQPFASLCCVDSQGRVVVSCLCISVIPLAADVIRPVSSNSVR